MPLSTQVRLLVLSGVVFVSVLILKIREERDSHSCRAAAQRPGLPVCQIVGEWTKWFRRAQGKAHILSEELNF